jgi:5-methylthioadenosine/S-adenosylhomocysteine deaminase
LSQKILVLADYLLKWGERLEIIPRGEIEIEGGIISYSGPARKKNEENFTRVIEGKNKLIMPGFINTHTHAAMSLFRGYADDMPLQEWLESRIWPVEARLNKRDIYWGTLLAICEMIRGGTTCFADMYFYMEEAAKACLESGIRASLSQGLVGLDAIKGLAALKEGKELVRDWHGKGEGKITVMLGPHAPYTCPPPYLRKVAEAAESLRVPIHIHLAETRKEIEESLKIHGKRPVELMEQIGLLKQKVLAAHCVHLIPEEIHMMAENKTAVAHNPGSNLKLGSGVAPLVDLMQNGVLVSLGTDGAASNNNLDMVEEMRLATLLPKGLGEDPTLIPAVEALKLATVNGAEALFLEEGVGTLSEGSKADLIMVNLNLPHLYPLHSIPAQIVYSALSSDVELAMVNGNILMEKGDLKTVDEERILFETAKISSRLVSQ